MSLEKRIEKAEEELQPEERARDLLITCVTEQHVRGADGVLVTVHREPVGYTEIQWSPPDRAGRRIGTRHARYTDEGDDPGNWNQNLPNAEVTGD